MVRPYTARASLRLVRSVPLSGQAQLPDPTIFTRSDTFSSIAAGNPHRGNLNETTSLLSPAAQSIDVTVANVLASTGFNTNCAVVNGAQSGVTVITVDAFHTMKVGDGVLL